jgi:hypothetical protein
LVTTGLDPVVHARGAANAVGAVNASKRRVRMDCRIKPGNDRRWARRADDLLIIESNCSPVQPFIELDPVDGQVNCPGSLSIGRGRRRAETG